MVILTNLVKMNLRAMWNRHQNTFLGRVELNQLFSFVVHKSHTPVTGFHRPARIWSSHKDHPWFPLSEKNQYRIAGCLYPQLFNVTLKTSSVYSRPPVETPRPPVLFRANTVTKEVYTSLYPQVYILFIVSSYLGLYELSSIFLIVFIFFRFWRVKFLLHHGFLLNKNTIRPTS